MIARTTPPPFHVKPLVAVPGGGMEGRVSHQCLRCKAPKSNCQFPVIHGYRSRICRHCSEINKLNKAIESNYRKTLKRISNDCGVAYRKFMRNWRPRRDYNQTARQRYHTDTAYRQAKIYKSRERYRLQADAERMRVRIWKHLNPDKAAKHGVRRWQRAAEQTDRTVTRKAIVALLAAAKVCPYCGVCFRTQATKPLTT